MHRHFRTAGKKFQVIAEQTTDILVPYGSRGKIDSGLEWRTLRECISEIIAKSTAVFWFLSTVEL